MPQKFSRLPPSSVRPLVVEYLQRRYESTAEPLPEAFQAQTEIAATQPQGVVRKRGKRPRHLFKSDPAADKGMKGHKAEAKFLPPGTILEYLELCRAEVPDAKIGRKVFCAVFCLTIVGNFLMALASFQTFQPSQEMISCFPSPKLCDPKVQHQKISCGSDPQP